jgi:hypothetical protein
LTAAGAVMSATSAAASAVARAASAACRVGHALARACASRRIEQAHQCTFEHIVVCKRWLRHIFRSPRIDRACGARHRCVAPKKPRSSRLADSRFAAPRPSLTLKASLVERFRLNHQPVVDAVSYQGLGCRSVARRRTRCNAQRSPL